MRSVDVYQIIERMVALIRSEERKRCSEFGIQAVHFQVMDYLSRCNRFSDTPAALTKYLGMTKGTVSQTLLLLERKGFIQKEQDANDKRVVHLKLIAKGEDVLMQASLADLFDAASSILHSDNPAVDDEPFVLALTALQKANKSNSFGLCKTCKHFNHTSEGFLCGLTKESLSKSDSEKICQEHTAQ